MPLPDIDHLSLHEVEHYDVLLIARHDSALCRKMLKFLSSPLFLHKSGRRLKVCTELDFLQFTTNKLNVLNMALNHSSRYFIILERDTEFDKWFQYSHDQAIMKTLTRGEKDLIVIKEQSDTPVPELLTTLRYFTLEFLFKGSRLSDLNVDNISLESVDNDKLQTLRNLLQCELNRSAAMDVSQVTEEGRNIMSRFDATARMLELRYGLLAKMFSASLIDMDVKRSLGSQADREPAEAERRTLRLAAKFSRQQMDRFLNCLRENNQKHVADFILKPSTSSD